MSKKPRLGRGLDALLGAAPEAASHENLTELPIEWLERGRFQPRRHFDEEALTELAASIKASGVVQPLVVRPLGPDRYELIAGERRWRAAQMAGLHQVPVVIKSLSDAAALAVALIENIQREDLNPVEEAHALSRLIEEFSLTHEEAATRVGRSRVAVTNLVRLLALDPEVLQALETGHIDMGHARALLGVDPRHQRALAREIVRKGLTVRAVERLIQALKSPARKERPETRDPDLRALEQELSDRLGARVRLTQRGSGAGRLVIDYTTADELEGLLQRLR